MADFNFEDIRSEVVEAGGIKCMQMLRLREASPYKKLGPGVNEEIGQALRQKGLGHTPLGSYQDESVYVFEEGSKAARLINAIIRGASAEGAREILAAVAPDSQSSRAETKLAEIKDLMIQMEDVFRQDEVAQPVAAVRE